MYYTTLFQQLQYFFYIFLSFFAEQFIFLTLSKKESKKVVYKKEMLCYNYIIGQYDRMTYAKNLKRINETN